MLLGIVHSRRSVWCYSTFGGNEGQQNDCGHKQGSGSSHISGLRFWIGGRFVQGSFVFMFLWNGRYGFFFQAVPEMTAMMK